MSVCGTLQSQLTSVMQTLVHSAICEMCKLVDEGSVFLMSLEITEEERTDRELRTQMLLGSEMIMSQFTSIMEDLGKEALRKIIGLVNGPKSRLKVNNTPRVKATPPDCLSVDWKDKDHSYAYGRSHNKVSTKSIGKQTDGPKSPLMTAVSAEDDDRQTDQGKIAATKIGEKEHPDDGSCADIGPDESFDEQPDSPESPNLTDDNIVDESGPVDGDDRRADIRPDESLADQAGKAESSFIIVTDECGNIDLEQLLAIQHLPAAAHWTSTPNAPSPLVSNMAVTAGGPSGISGSSGRRIKSKPKSDSQQRKSMGEKSCVCEICGKAYRVIGELNRHMKMHSGIRPFTCEVCSKSFADRKTLRTHMITHTGERPFGCPECGKKFSHAQNLKRHRLCVHGGVKAFSCHICQQKFTQAHSLKDHLLRHTGQKPHKCPVCNKSFRTRQILKSHQAVHMDGESFTCEHCGNSYRRRSALWVHKYHKHHTLMQRDQKKSTDTVQTVAEKCFTCEECGKGFGQKAALIIHRRMHSGEKPFSCTHCQKCFSTAGNLKIHTRIHTGEKPYSCDLCGKTFIQNSHLYTHKRYFHVKGKQFVCDKCGRMYVNPGNLKAHKCRVNLAGGGE